MPRGAYSLEAGSGDRPGRESRRVNSDMMATSGSGRAISGGLLDVSQMAILIINGLEIEG